MATDGIERFLRAEEEANRLVEELTQLKEETESYQTARKALGEASKGVAGLATRLSDISGRLGGVVETLRSIGTPELLQGQEAVTREVGSLRQDLASTQESILGTLESTITQVRGLCETIEAAERVRRDQLQTLQQNITGLATAASISDLKKALEKSEEASRTELQVIKDDLGAKLVSARAEIGTARSLALGSIALLVITVGLLGWLTVVLAGS